MTKINCFEILCSEKDDTCAWTPNSVTSKNPFGRRRGVLGSRGERATTKYCAEGRRERVAKIQCSEEERARDKNKLF